MKNDPAFISFVASMLAARIAYFNRHGFTFAVPVVLTEEGQKFIRIVHADSRNGEPPTNLSAIGFVAKEDFTNRTLGTIKKGDILMAASYKAPAKNVRGNIYNSDNGASAMNENGRVAYLR